MSSDVRVHPGAESLAEAVAEALIARLSDIQAEGRVPVVGLTGGTIAAAVHRKVASSLNGFDVDWDEVDFWWGDERYVDSNSGERNARQARRDLLDQIEADPGRIHEMPGTDSGLALADAAEDYAATLRTEGGGKFDVLFLGIGPDGHIASLFPGSEAVTTTGALTVPVSDSPKPPAQRISLTLEALNHADAVWFIASGAGKADAVAAAHADGSVTEIPARGVTGQNETVWWLDRQAGSALG
ncbi:6-phosphogluconolactonase [Nocardioides daedukensis]|uniref:6-phosphogluconolactonase n=1 Tax=Nocardioides daedukensis TaxID=634462 RepID=A0A7Y9S088_9ACTN|nr:6-phosphogluconolactonase [Nocardioides daedukensis]NYG57758.1 6-phosphogluconolactonase [Nocardioides daedukensis]